MPVKQYPQIRQRVIRALKKAYPDAKSVSVENPSLIHTTLFWKSVAFRARCAVTRQKKESFIVFGGWDSEHPLSKEKTHLLLAYLWNNGFSKPPIFVSEPIIFDRRQRLILYKLFNGKTLSSIVQKKRGGSPKTPFQYVGEWAAEFHKLPPLLGIPRNTDAFDENEHRKHCRTFASSAPGFFSGSDLRIAKKISGSALKKRAQIRKNPRCRSMVHDDFHTQNIIVSPEQNSVAVIDFDKARVDDPLDDVAEFLIRLDSELFYRKTPFPMIHSLQKIFLRAYEKKRGKRLSLNEAGRLSIHTQWTALRLLQYTFEANYSKKKHRHLSKTPLCRLEDRFWQTALDPDKFLKPLL